ncbi:AMP-dependent synthetase/ligase [soil metagenome]
MSRLLASLRSHAAAQPHRPALQDRSTALTYGDLCSEVERLADKLRGRSPRCLAILADNSCTWVLADLAALVAGIPSVPLPLFFSAAQMRHVIRAAGIDMLLTDQPRTAAALLAPKALKSTPFAGNMHAIEWANEASIDGEPGPQLPTGTAKVTFTSGTTGEPKGVCLGLEELDAVAESLRVASAANRDDRHLCLLPLSTLLENIAGVYTPLLTGATVCVPGLADVGLAGSSGLDVKQLVGSIGEWRASTFLTVPQTLRAIVAAAQAGAPLPPTLRYVAVGGAPVSPLLLADAASQAIPVFEGFGLSECASVVAVNSPGGNRPGSVGKPLPHVRVSFADDGEILIRGPRWRGYLGGPAPREEEQLIATGDIGHLDSDGFLYLTGRKKNIFITSFGRNVAPEWVERELVARAPIVQAAVFGEAQPFNVAVLWCGATPTTRAIDAAMQSANEALPDYARIRRWLLAEEPFTPRNGMLTANGRLRRERILAAFSESVEGVYSHANLTEPDT